MSLQTPGLRIRKTIALMAACSVAALGLADDKEKDKAKTPESGGKDGKEAAVELKEGDKAPDFEAKDDAGKAWKLAEHVGKRAIVVYFYPADFTGGCTKQACGFRDDAKALAEKGVEVVGVSGDSVSTHALFKKEHQLSFTLLADEDGAIARKFGVPTSKGGQVKAKVGGKEETLTRGVTASRWTFVIGKDGKIAHKNSKVDAAKDSKAILELVAALEKKGK